MSLTTMILRGYSLMFRALSIALLSSLVVMLMFSSIPGNASPTIGLKQNSVLTDNTIKLGDVFYGLSNNEDKILGPAPRPVMTWY